MRYILNSAVITSPGTYRYELIGFIQEVKEWLAEGDYTSTIGYQETADALSQLTGVPIPLNRKIIVMEPGDEALVFRLTLKSGDDRLKVQMKGREGITFIMNHCEIGLLTKIE